MRFLVKSSNIHPLPGNPHMLHIATIGYGLREFIVMHCIQGPTRGNTYIEEVVLTSRDFTEDVTAHCKFIEDDNLAGDLAAFVQEKKLLDVERITGQLLERGRGQWLLGSRDSKKL